MSTALGLLVIVLWIVVVIALAAAVTWVVVKLFPADRADDSTAPEPPVAS